MTREDGLLELDALDTHSEVRELFAAPEDGERRVMRHTPPHSVSSGVPTAGGR